MVPYFWRKAVADDAAMIWSWWTAKHAVYWNVAGRVGGDTGGAAVAAYLDRNVAIDQQSLICCLGAGEPFAYGEIYTVGFSALSSHEVVPASSRGMHLLLADDRLRMRPPAVAMVAGVIDHEFDQRTDVDHFIGDPDSRNAVIESVGKQLGMREIAQVTLPYKTARVMAVERQDWMDLRDRINRRTDMFQDSTNWENIQ